MYVFKQQGSIRVELEGQTVRLSLGAIWVNMSRERATALATALQKLAHQINAEPVGAFVEDEDEEAEAESKDMGMESIENDGGAA